MHHDHVHHKEQQHIPDDEDGGRCHPVLRQQQRLFVRALQRMLPDIVWDEVDGQPDQAWQQQQVIQDAQDRDEVWYEILQRASGAELYNCIKQLI